MPCHSYGMERVEKPVGKKKRAEVLFNTITKATILSHVMSDEYGVKEEM